jgi:hypothetical protein
VGRRATSTGPGRRAGSSALYDAVKDTIVADDSGLVLARVSIWDPLDGGPLLGEALDGVAVEPRAVLELVERRRAPV